MIAALAIAVAVVSALVDLADDPDASISAATPAAGVRGLYVLPDDTAAPLLTEIEAAKSSVDVSVYLLTDPVFVNALTGAEDRGVSVRVILDPAPYGGGNDPDALVPELTSGGVEVRWGVDDVRFTHIKTIVIDDTVAMILNVNLTRSSFVENREFGVITTVPDDVQEAAVLFEADWSGATPGSGPLIVSPYDARSELSALIAGAMSSVEMYAEVIRDAAMVDLLASTAQRGVPVRIVLPPDSDPAFTPVLARLLEAGVQVRFLTAPYAHAKAILVDGKALFVGSQNFTSTSLDENRELGIVVSEQALVARFAGVFERDWAAAEPALATPVAAMR